MITLPYKTSRTKFLDLAMFHNVSVATLLTYKHNNILRLGLSINIEKTLDKNAGIADTVNILKFPRIFLKQHHKINEKT